MRSNKVSFGEILVLLRKFHLIFIFVWGIHIIKFRLLQEFNKFLSAGHIKLKSVLKFLNIVSYQKSFS